MQRQTGSKQVGSVCRYMRSLYDTQPASAFVPTLIFLGARKVGKAVDADQ